MAPAIRRYLAGDAEAIIALSIAAWTPVFESFEQEMGPDVYRLVYPDWRSMQADAVTAVCHAEDTDVWVAAIDDRPVGFVANAAFGRGQRHSV